MAKVWNKNYVHEGIETRPNYRNIKSIQTTFTENHFSFSCFRNPQRLGSMFHWNFFTWNSRKRVDLTSTWKAACSPKGNVDALDTREKSIWCELASFGNSSDMAITYEWTHKRHINTKHGSKYEAEAKKPSKPFKENVLKFFHQIKNFLFYFFFSSPIEHRSNMVYTSNRIAWWWRLSWLVFFASSNRFLFHNIKTKSIR